VTFLHIKSEELLFSTWNVKSDSSQHQYEQWFLCVFRWRVIPPYIVCEVWLVSTSNLKSDSIPNVKSYSSPHQIWKVTSHHIKCEEWLLCTSNVKSLTPLYMKCWEWLLSTQNEKSDSSPNVKSDSSTSKLKSDYHLRLIWTVTPNVMSDYSPHQMCRVSPLLIKFKVTPLHIKYEEWLLFISNVKSDSYPHQMWRVWLLYR
jgi:hypothetical protein